MRLTETQARTETHAGVESSTQPAKTDHLRDPLSSQSLHDSLGGAVQMQEEEEEMQMKSDSSPIQRQEEEEEEMQAKAESSPIQRQEEEEEEMQMKEDDGAQRARGVSFSNSGGEPLADGVRGKMESSFGADFSDVKVHRDGAAADLGAKAFTQGNHIHVKPGIDTGSASGQALLGHELSHVQQQRAGRVAVQGKGLPINRDPTLEAEADREGAKAAAGKRVR